MQNYSISVKEKGDDIIFLRKIIPGGGDKSYGIQVAKLAGVPDYVIQRAKEILEELSEADIVKKTHKIAAARTKAPEPVQLNLFHQEKTPLEKSLLEIDVNNITPLEALMLLRDLQMKVER